jgi:hypothetical protein
MKNITWSILLTLIGAAAAFPAGSAGDPLVVTASNAVQNQLLVYDATGHLLQTLTTGAKGGVSGNSGGIAAWNGLVAAVNFGSQTVSVFDRVRNRLVMSQSIPTASSPVSVAFGHNHLYILGTTKVESHLVFGRRVNTNPDGVVTLLKADGSAAQVGVLPNQVIISEKSNVIETVDLLFDNSVNGLPVLVMHIPSNVDTPFGLVTRGNNAYVTIAHADETSLVRNGAVLTTTPSGTQHAPCWAALVGPFLYTANSPSMSVSRYAVYGQKIVQDAAVAASFKGTPTDIASGAGLVAVIDGEGSTTHLSIFNVDEDGNLTVSGSADINAAANGVAVVTDFIGRP